MCQWTGSTLVQLWPVACPSLSHYLNQCWCIVKWTLPYKIWWHLSQNAAVSFKETHSKMSSATYSAWSLNVPGLSLNKISRLQRPWWHFWQPRAAVQGPLLALVLLNLPGKTNRYLHFQSFLSYWDSKVVETCTYGEQRLLRPAYHSC